MLQKKKMTKLKQKNDTRKKLVDVSIFKLRPTKSRLNLIKPILYEEAKIKELTKNEDDEKTELIIDDDDVDTVVEDDVDEDEQVKCNKKPSTVVLIKSTTINNNNDNISERQQEENVVECTKQKTTTLAQTLFKILGTSIATYSYGFTALKLFDMFYPQILPAASYKITNYLAPILNNNEWLPTSFNNSITDYITLTTPNLFFKTK